MKSFRVLAVSGILIFITMLAACGGGGSTPPPPPAQLAIASTVLPNATVNVAYVFNFRGTGGTGTYVWSISKGALPPGMSLNSQLGQLFGTATASGVFKFTVKLTDGASDVATADETLTVEGALLINCDSCAPGTHVLPFGNPGTSYSATLSATGGQTPYTWCVIESDGSCDNGSKGALPAGLTLASSNNEAVISGIPITPGIPTAFTVQVSDSETVPSTGTAALTITIFDVGPKTLPNATLNSPYNQTLSALGGVAPYSICIMESDGSCDNGTHGALPPGLALSTCVHSQRPACTLTGTPTQVGTTTFTVQATDGETPSATASEQVSITVGQLANNQTLNGQYAMVFSGYHGGTAFLMLGSMTFDGNGNITAGSLDYNDGNGEANNPSNCLGNPLCPVPQTVQSGSTYDLSDGTGLGTIALSTTDGSGNPHTYNFRVSVSGAACKPDRLLDSCGTLIETDPQSYGSGYLKVQNPANLSVNHFFPGNFAIGITGYDVSGNRYGAAGALGTNPHTLVDIDCDGNGWGLNYCPLDINSNGNNNSGTTAVGQFKGTFSSTVDPTTGRGQFVQLTFATDPNGYCPGGGPSSVCGYAYYIINSEQMFILSTNPTSWPANLTMWTLNRQLSSGLGWTAASIGPNNIVELNAKDGSKADVTVGLMTSDQTGDGTFASDENDGGTLTQQAAAPGTYSISTTGKKTGQVILGAFPQFGAGGAVMYLYSGSTGIAAFIVGTDTKVSTGLMEPQSPIPPGNGYSNGSFSGNYEGGTIWPIIAGVTNSISYLHADGIGNAAGTQYTSGPGGSGGPNNLTLTYQVDGTGRGVVSQSGNPYGFLYVVGPTKVAMVPTGNNPALNIFIAGQPD